MPRKAKSIANRKVRAGKLYPLNMRTTDEVRRKLEDAAKTSGRSLAQEVEARLLQSFIAAMHEAARAHNEQVQADIIHDLHDMLGVAQDRISELESKQSEMIEQACLNALAKVGLTPRKDSES